MRLALFALLALVAGPTALAQSYAVTAAQDQLDGAVPQCLTLTGSDPDDDLVFLYFDAVGQTISAYVPGAELVVEILGAAELDAVAGTDVDRCRDADAALVTDVRAELAFAVSDADNADRVIQVTADSGVFSAQLLSADADGTAGLALGADAQTVYLARSAFNGAPEDGVYTLVVDQTDQTPAVVLQNPDLDLNGIDLGPDGSVYAASSEFGTAPYQNVVVALDDPAGTPALRVAFDPFALGVFVNPTDGGIEDLAVTGEGVVYVVNNAFASPDGETVARFNPDGTGGTVVFTQAGLVAQTGIAEYTTSASNGYLGGVVAGGDFATVYLAGSDGFGGVPGIYEATEFTLAAGELPRDVAGLTIAPNPAAGSAEVRIALAEAGPLRAEVFDLLGRRVAVLWDGPAAGSVVLPTGALRPAAYLVRVTTAAGIATERLRVVR